MSDDSVPEEEVRIETDVLDLRKRASRSSTEYPVFEYRIDYRGSSPGELALAESLPDGLDESDVEFHPDFHGENWTCDGERVFFEIMVPEAQVVETKFGLSVEDPAAVETVLSPPLVTVDDLDTGERIASLSADDAETVLPDDGMDPVEPAPVSDAVRDIILGDEGDDAAPDPETLTASDDDEEDREAVVAGTTGDEEVVTAAPSAGDDGGDGDDGDGGDATAPADDGDTTAPDDDAPASDPAPPEGDDLVAEAVDAVVSGAESDAAAETDDDEAASDGDGEATTDDRTATASAVGSESGDDDGASAAGGATPARSVPGDGGSVGAALAAELRAGEIPEADVELLRERLNLTVAESDAVRLRDLQSRYHDLEAYTEALSAFVDEHGEADGVLADLQGDVERLDDELAALSAAEERLDDLEHRLDERPDGDELRDRVDDVVADLDAAERRLDERVSGVETRLSDLEATVGELEDQTEVLLELQDVFGTD